MIPSKTAPVSARRRARQNGNEMFEFALFSMVMVPLLIWTFVTSFNLVRFNECQQINRDIANQYIHGVDFTTYEAQQVAQRLAQGFNLQIGSSFTGNEANNSSNAGGNAYFLLSQVMYVGAGTCSTANPCTNENKYVFVQQIGFGTSTVAFNGSQVYSRLGSMTAAVNSYGYIDNILTDTGAVCANCSTFFTTQLSDGQTAYVVEAFFSDPSLSFSALPGGGIYTVSFM